MKKLYSIKTNTYKYSEDIRVDIKIDYLENEYSAYVYDKRYVPMLFMFGCPIDQQSYREFLKIVEANVPDYLEDLYENCYRE